MQHQPRIWEESRAMFVQDLVRLQTNITAEISIANVMSFKGTCSNLVKRFNGIWNKSDASNAPKKAPAPKPAKTVVAPTANPVAQQKSAINNPKQGMIQPTKVSSRVICHFLPIIQHTLLLHCVLQVENEAKRQIGALSSVPEEDANERAPILKDILRLQLHSLNNKVINAKTKISGTNHVCVMTEATPESEPGSVPRLNQIHVIPVNVVPAIDEQSPPGALASNVPDNAQEPPKDQKLDELASAEAAPEHIKLSTSRPQTPRATDDATETAILQLVKQILQNCPAELKSFCRPKERVLGEAAILAVLKKYMAPIGESVILYRIGSVLYRITSQKSDFNMLISSSKNDHLPLLLKVEFLLIRLGTFSFSEERFQSDALFQLLVDRLNADAAFDSVYKVPGDRVEKPHLRMVHKETGIRCSLHAAAEELARSSTIIAEVIEFKPIGTTAITVDTLAISKAHSSLIL